jgi:hypothetical protein
MPYASSSIEPCLVRASWENLVQWVGFGNLQDDEGKIGVKMGANSCCSSSSIKDTPRTGLLSSMQQ